MNFIKTWSVLVFNMIVIAGIFFWLGYIFSFKGRRSPPIDKTERTLEQQTLLQRLHVMPGTFFSAPLLERIIKTKDLSCFERCNMKVYTEDDDLVWEYRNIPNKASDPQYNFEARDLSARVLTGHIVEPTKFKLSLCEDNKCYVTSTVGTHNCTLMLDKKLIPGNSLLTIDRFNLNLPKYG